MGFSEMLVDVLSVVYIARAVRLGDRAAEEVEPTSRGKRQSRLEQEIVGLLSMKAGTREGLRNVNIIAEDNDPIEFPGATYTMYVDPVDGTAGFARTIQGGVETSDPATVITIVPNHDGVTFGEIIASGGVNLRSGQIWVAEVGKGAFTARTGAGVGFVRIAPIRLYDRHSPLLASEFYRLINRLTMFLINQPLEWSDLHSSFLNILQVPLGKADCFFNNVLPDVSNEGQRGHELGAIMPFLKEVQGYALDTRTMHPLAETPFTFDGMTPVIIGVDKPTADYYLEMIQANLGKRVPGFIGVSVREMIAAIHSTVGIQRWSLRPLA